MTTCSVTLFTIAAATAATAAADDDDDVEMMMIVMTLMCSTASHAKSVIIKMSYNYHDP